MTTIIKKSKFDGFKPFFILQILIFLLLAIVVAGFFVMQYKVKQELVLNKVTYKQTASIVAGQTVQWSAFIKKSDLSNSNYLLKLPKGSKNVKIQSITQQQATVGMGAKQVQLADLAKRQKLALNQKSDKLLSGFLADVENTADAVVQLVVGSVEKLDVLNTGDSTIVDLSNQVPEVIPPAEAPVSTVTNPATEIPVAEPVVNEPVKNSSDFVQVTYETPAPEITSQTTDTGKIVTVSALTETPNQPPLVDVLASTKIPEIFKVGQEKTIKIKWKNNGNQNVSFHAYDTDNNGKLDYVEWTVPHLSTQTFEIIFISKAFQLDSDQNIIGDIYGAVKTKDGNYVSLTNGQYVRATFNKVLTNKNDNTIYARPTDPAHTVTIGVYPVYTEADGNQTEGPKVATFQNIGKEAQYKVLLTNLQTPTDIFDLKISGNIDIDYIVDPVVYGTCADDGATCGSNAGDSFNCTSANCSFSGGCVDVGQCSFYDNPSFCAASLCSWTGGPGCTSDGTTCTGITDETACSAANCFWNSATSSCWDDGRCPDQTNRQNCSSYGHCSFSGSCGDPGDCGNWSYADGCNFTSHCFWLGSCTGNDGCSSFTDDQSGCEGYGHCAFTPADCTAESDCNGNGTCTAPDTCTCTTNYDPTNGCASCLDNFDINFGCNSCLPGWTGPFCDGPDNSICNNNGTYDPNAKTCTCSTGWDSSTNCGSCAAGWEGVFCDQFIDSTPPTTPGTPSTSSSPSNNKPAWAWSASTDEGSGLANPKYTVQWCGSSDYTDCSSNTATTNTESYTHSTALAGGTWYFRVKATDVAGNPSSWSSNGVMTIYTTCSADDDCNFPDSCYDGICVTGGGFGVSPTDFVWVQTSPHNSTSITASWTKSDSSNLIDQEIQFYSSNNCANASVSGSLIDLSSNSVETRAFTGTNGNTYTYRIISAYNNADPTVSNCSSAMTIDTTGSVITITNPDDSSASSKTITATKSDGTLTMSNTTGSTCDESLTFVAYSSQTFTDPSSNGTKVCYKAVDTAGNITYSLSSPIAGIIAGEGVSGGGGVTYYTINVQAGVNGSINPNGPASLPYGSNQTYTITPASGYGVADVLVDGISKGAITSYTFGSVTGDHTISAIFSAVKTTQTPSENNTALTQHAIDYISQILNQVRQSLSVQNPTTNHNVTMQVIQNILVALKDLLNAFFHQ